MDVYEAIKDMPRPYHDDGGGRVIFHGDCRELLPLIPDGAVDLVLTDPPYGINADKNQSSRANKKSSGAATMSRDYGDIRFDDAPPTDEELCRAINKGRDAIVFGGNYFGLPPSSCWFVWDKDNGSNGYADCELAWTSLDGAIRRIRYRWHGMLQEHGGIHKEDRVHPTQKPVAVVRWCINRFADSQIILDPYMGSGTTLRAAKDLGRQCIGIEIEERYCEIAATRLAQEVLF